MKQNKQKTSFHSPLYYPAMQIVMVSLLSQYTGG